MSFSDTKTLKIYGELAIDIKPTDILAQPEVAACFQQALANVLEKLETRGLLPAEVHCAEKVSEVYSWDTVLDFFSHYSLNSHCLEIDLNPVVLSFEIGQTSFENSFYMVGAVSFKKHNITSNQVNFNLAKINSIERKSFLYFLDHEVLELFISEIENELEF